MIKKVNYEQQAKKFAELLIDMCFDDDFEDMEDGDWYRLKACQYDGWQETMCRWLFKFGYIDKTENGDWYRKGDENE